MNAHANNIVRIVITEDHIAVIDPAVVELERVLEYRTRRFQEGGTLGWTEVEELCTLGGFDFRGRLAVPAGLLDRVRSALQEHGYIAEVTDQRTHTVSVDPDVYSGLGTRDRALIKAIARNPLGRIEVASDSAALPLYQLLDQAFPSSTFVVATTTNEPAVAAWNAIVGVVSTRPGLVVPGRRFSGVRWLVGTCTQIDPSKFDVGNAMLILPDAETSTGERMSAWVIRMGFRRCYVLVRAGRQYDRYTQLRLEQLGGPLIQGLGQPRVPVRVVMLPVPLGAIEARGSAAANLALERKRVWYQGPRV